MTNTPDTGIHDFCRSSLTLRSDLVWVPQLSEGQSYYLVEDPLNAKFYRVGFAEYFFASQLDGTVTVGQAIQATAGQLTHAAFSEQEARAICQWLVKCELVETNHVEVTANCDTGPEQVAALQRWNPLYIRLPLLHPRRFFDRLSGACRFLFSPFALGMWLFVVACASLVLLHDWSGFLQSARGVFAPYLWLLLPAAWLLLKLLHETAHGVVCHRFGGEVREAGVVLILFMPVTYVDVTSCWRFRSKWQRIATAAAGMMVELFVAALALIAWKSAGPGVFSTFCCAVAIMASATTVLFNSNCLMRFDGYYIVSDLLEIPNLSQAANQEFMCVTKRLLGLNVPIPATRPQSWFKRWFLLVYAVLAFWWRLFVFACIVITASALFDGAGIVLAVFATLAWVVLPVHGLVTRVRGAAQDGPHAGRRQRLAVAGPLLGAAAIAMVPWQGVQVVPAVVEFTDLAVVRTDCPGFVQRVHVQHGQFVQQGDVLLQLKNDELQSELRSLELAVQQSHLKIRTLEYQRDLASWQAEQQQLAALQSQLAEMCQQAEHLTLLAPRDGRVINRDLANLEGRFLDVGHAVLSIGEEQQKEIRLAIAQDAVENFQAVLRRKLHVRFPGSDTLEVALTQLRATSDRILPPRCPGRRQWRFHCRTAPHR